MSVPPIGELIPVCREPAGDDVESTDAEGLAAMLDAVDTARDAGNGDDGSSNAPLVEDVVARTWSALGRLGRLAGKVIERAAADFVVAVCDGATAGQRRRDIFPLPFFEVLDSYGLADVPALCVEDALCYLHWLVRWLNRIYGITQTHYALLCSNAPQRTALATIGARVAEYPAKMFPALPEGLGHVLFPRALHFPPGSGANMFVW